MDETEVQDVQGVEPEKTLTQSQVNDIVKREKAQVAERVRREMESQMAGSKPDFDQEAIVQSVMNRVMEEAKRYEELEAKKAKEAQDAQEKEMLQRKADEFYLRFNSGKDKYSDFEEVMRDFEPQDFPRVAFLAAETGSDGQPFDTTGIMYELAKSPQKLAYINELSFSSPKLAKREIERLNQSIIKNQQAVESNVTAREPLSRLKSSSSVGADTGQMTLRDYKNAPWLRG